MSMPISRMASTAPGFNPWGLVPALATSKWSFARRRRSPSAIWLRPEFPVQRKSTLFFMRLPLHQDAQKELPTRPQVRQKAKAYPLGYIEDSVEPRTKLEGFFSLLLGKPMSRAVAHRADG